MKAIIKFSLLFTALVIVLGSCTNYGKKITVEGTKGEVYYKGDGISKTDAQKLADYLKKSGYFDSTEKSVQLQKAKTAGYDLRFVVNEKKLKEAGNADEGFELFGALISKNVFDNQPVNVFLADNKMKDITSLPYNKDKAEALLATQEKKTENTATTNSNEPGGYNHDTAGDVNFYWKDISNDEAKTIADFIVKTGDFSGGSSEIYMTKEGDRYLLKFPMQEQYANDAAYQAKVGEVAKKIKDNVFVNSPYSFVITDVHLNTVKSFDF